MLDRSEQAYVEHLLRCIDTINRVVCVYCARVLIICVGRIIRCHPVAG